MLQFALHFASHQSGLVMELIYSCSHFSSIFFLLFGNFHSIESTCLCWRGYTIGSRLVCSHVFFLWAILLCFLLAPTIQRLRDSVVLGASCLANLMRTPTLRRGDAWCTWNYLIIRTTLNDHCQGPLERQIPTLVPPFCSDHRGHQDRTMGRLFCYHFDTNNQCHERRCDTYVRCCYYRWKNTAIKWKTLNFVAKGLYGRKRLINVCVSVSFTTALDADSGALDVDPIKGFIALA